MKATTGLSKEVLELLSGQELDEVVERGVERLEASVGDSAPQLYWTVGVYNNDSWKQNYVRAGDLVSHIKYNLALRPGRAFFVNGICLNHGYLPPERIAGWEAKLAEQGIPEMTRSTVPYQ